MQLQQEKSLIFRPSSRSRDILELILLAFLEFRCNSCRGAKPGFAGGARTFFRSRT